MSVSYRRDHFKGRASISGFVNSVCHMWPADFWFVFVMITPVLSYLIRTKNHGIKKHPRFLWYNFCNTHLQKTRHFC